MKKRHSARAYDTTPGRESAPLDDVESFTKFLHKLWSLQEIIAVIGIAHDNIFPSGSDDPTHERAAISSLAHVDQTSAEFRRDSLTSIAASIISNDNFSGYFLFI